MNRFLLVHTAPSDLGKMTEFLAAAAAAGTAEKSFCPFCGSAPSADGRLVSRPN